MTDQDLREKVIAWFREGKMDGLAKIGAAAVPVLIELHVEDEIRYQKVKSEYDGTRRNPSLVSTPNLFDSVFHFVYEDENRDRPYTEAFIKIGPPAIPALLKALVQEAKQHPGQTPPPGITKALAGIGLPAVPALMEALREEKDIWIGAILCDTLAMIGMSAVPALTDTLKDTDTIVRWHALVALEGMAEKIAEKAEGAGLENVRERLREFVAFVKSKAGAAEADRIEKAAARAYIKACSAFRERTSRKHSLSGDGVILVGELPKPPSDGKKMYRQARATA